MTPVVLPLVLALAGAQVRVEVGIRNENRGGLVPIPTQIEDRIADSFDVIDIEVLPSVGVEVTNRRHSLSLKYEPRFLQRILIELASETNSLLVLHRLEGAHSFRISRDLLLASTLNASSGKLDFAGAVRFARNFQTTRLILDAQALDYNFLQATTGLIQNVTRQTQLRIGAEVAYTQPGAPEEMLSIEIDFPRFVEFQLVSELTHRLNELDSIYARVPARWFDFDTGDPVQVVTVETGWFHRRSENFRLGAGIGLTISDNRGQQRWFPTGRIFANVPLVHARGFLLLANASTGVELLPNPDLSVVDPQAFVSAGFELRMRERFIFSPSASFFTIATANPRPASEFLADTFISVSAPARYAFTENVEMQAGLRMSVRGPHLRSEPFQLDQLELVGFLGFRAVYGQDLF